TVKTVDRAADLGERMKKALVRTADQAQNLTDDGQVTPSEYAGDKLQYGMEDIATEAGHIVVDTGKGTYRTGKSAIQKFREKRRAEAEQRRQELENEHPDTPVDEPTDPVTTDQPGPATPPESPVEEEIVTPSGSQQRKTRLGKSPTGDGPKGKLNPAKDGTDAIQKEQRIKGPARRKNNSIKALQKTEKTIKQTTRTAEQSAKTLERSVKGTQKAVKTAEQSSKVAIKTAQETAKAAQKSAQAAAKAAEKAVQIARATARAAAAAAKAAAKACVAAVKAIIAAVKELVAAIAAGGWVAVVIIIVIMLVALIVGSCFGIFFSSEDTGSPMTMKSVVQEINMDYQSSLDTIRNMTVHDKMETSGARAVWPEVLAIYAVKVNTDPNNPQDVASMDDAKKAMLKEIFWEMNQINSRVETTEETVLIETVDEDGNIVVTETTETVTTLYITVTHKTAMTMAYEYGFTEEQKQMLNELLQDENASMWAAVLYGIHSADEQIVAVAESQIGNVGGQPYWSWYGFNSRVAWCACFVSWCANECGYIDAGVIPKFAGCVWGVDWFQDRGQWADGTATPVPGMIIFFDWDSPDGESGPQDGLSDHVGIVQKVEDGYVYTIEGNTSDSCAQRRYRIGYYEILGYGIPAY
ncbi:MAG: CHAP domain-containing protein, partial [Bacteroides sp]|nr:CHAP domain-containing protein [Bacteroidaceae bacterium]MBQ3191524.1 CHAP domain-containing protein [Bacteroides sp.]